jgi:hypothetical protein
MSMMDRMSTDRILSPDVRGVMAKVKRMPKGVPNRQIVASPHSTGSVTMEGGVKHVAGAAKGYLTKGQNQKGRR